MLYWSFWWNEVYLEFTLLKGMSIFRSGFISEQSYHPNVGLSFLTVSLATCLH